MKLITPNEIFSSLKWGDEIVVECEFCKKHFKSIKHEAQWAKKRKDSRYLSFCSMKCKHDSFKIKVDVICKCCNKQFKKIPSQIRGKFNFCSKSCATTYNNKNKTTGYRRSKLEIWLEEKLTNKYPTLEIHYNKKDAIESELDIFIPSLKLAIELNGIFHYEPIYSEEKLKKTKINDERKIQACIERRIEFCIIDVSSFGYFKELGAKKYLDIIENIVNKKLESKKCGGG